MSTAPELSARQRFELAMRCVAVEDATADLVEPFAELVRFAAAEGITPGRFAARDRYPLMHALTAATMLAFPGDFDPGSLGHRALAAAGYAPPGTEVRG